MTLDQIWNISEYTPVSSFLQVLEVYLARKHSRNIYLGLYAAFQWP
jgi:uncharacterized protein YktA (UPF0223 family)